jgi:hypothetical protein
MGQVVSVYQKPLSFLPWSLLKKYLEKVKKAGKCFWVKEAPCSPKEYLLF